MKKNRTQADDLKDQIKLLDLKLRWEIFQSPNFVTKKQKEIYDELSEKKSILWNIK